MEATINRTTEDIIYAGADLNVANTIREKCPKNSFRQIANYAELESYLIDRMQIFQLARGCGLSGLKLQQGIYPKLLLVIPDLPESKDTQKTVPFGPGIVYESRSSLRFVETYLLVNDEAYEQNKKGLKSFCERENVPIIKESELEERLADLLK